MLTTEQFWTSVFCILFQHLLYLSYNKSMTFLPSLLLHGVRFCKQISQVSIHCSSWHTTLFPDPELSWQCWIKKKYILHCEICTNYLKVREIFQIHMNIAIYLHVHTARWSILFFLCSNVWHNELEVYQIKLVFPH